MDEKIQKGIQKREIKGKTYGFIGYDRAERKTENNNVK